MYVQDDRLICFRRARSGSSYNIAHKTTKLHRASNFFFLFLRIFFFYDPNALLRNSTRLYGPILRGTLCLQRRRGGKRSGVVEDYDASTTGYH